MTIKNFIVAIILIASSASSYSADLGVGLSLNSYSTTIYLPIDFEGFRVEPSLSHAWGEGTTYYRYNTIGTGVFKTTPLNDNSQSFYGARFMYTLSEYNTYGYIKTKTYIFSPTVGFEYYLNKNFAIGGEVYLQYSTDDSTSTNSKSTSTGSMATLKYFFR